MIDPQYDAICLESKYHGLNWAIIKDGLEYCGKDTPPYEGDKVLGSVAEPCNGPWECEEPLYAWDTDGSGVHWSGRKGGCNQCGCKLKDFGRGIFLACPQWVKKSVTWELECPKRKRQAGKHRVYCVACSTPS